MDRNSNRPNTADALLEKLKVNLQRNADDKETIAAEKAAASSAQGKRYTFRVMKRAEYLEKKRIADALASAADDADISDEDLEALLRTYLKDSPRSKTIVETVPEEAAPTAEPAPALDLDRPLSREPLPFFEDTPIEVEPTPAKEADLANAVPAEIGDDDDMLDALDELLSMLPDDAPEDDSTAAQNEDEDIAAALLSDAAANEMTDDDIEALVAALQSTTAAADTADIRQDEAPTEEAAPAADEDELSEDDDLAALLAEIPDEEPQDADTDEDADAPMSPDDIIGDSLDELFGASPASKTPAAISDEELAAMLAAIEGEDRAADDDTDPGEMPEDMAEDTAEDAAADAETALPDDLLDDDALLDALAALEDDTVSEPDTAVDTADIAEDAPAADIAETEDTEAQADDDNAAFDQTDLDLMIAFGMEDQLEKAVGHEQAKKYRKAIGERGNDHYNEMHSGDRPDTVQDKHAEYVSAAQNREIFAEYKKKYSAMLFRFLGALFFLVLLFFFENDRLLGITMPALFDREQYPLVYTLFDLQLVVLSGAMVWKGIKTGIRAILRGRPVPESITGFLFLACIVYTAIIAALCPMHGLQLYNFPLGLAVLFALCYEFMNLRREIMSFKIVSSKKLKYAVDAIAPKDGEAERKMFAEYISDDPALFRIKRTAFVESFFARTETYPRTQRILRAVLPASLLLTLAFFAAKFILTGSVYEALTAAYITMLLTLPSCAFIAFSYPMYRASGFAYEKESAMIGEASLGEYADASVVSFDDKEVFPARGVRVRNVKVYGENRIDHVIYAAASVFHVVGGPLADVFETATGELGYAENVKLTRLDRDGIEARVDGGTVLIGRAAFVNRYGYSVSLGESEKSMEETGDASILYIAYDNNVAAKLYIQYSVEPDFEVVLKQLYRQGVCVGIKTSDPNIDDHLLSCKIKMSKYPVKIIKCAEPKETAIIVDRLSSGIVSKSSAKALLQTLAICDRVLSASRTNNVLGIVSIFLGMAAMAFYVISGMAITMAPIWIALYQLFWIIPIVAISRYYI